MKGKKRWNKLKTVSLLLSFPVLLFIGGFLLPIQYGETFLGELKEKQQRLYAVKGKKIVLLGGSSVAFGVDSRLLKQEFEEYEIVNYGMYAALGTGVMLDLSKEALSEGDIVLIIPEQQRQTLSEYFNGTAVWQAFDGAFGMLGYCHRDNWGELVSKFPQFAAQKWLCFCRGEKIEPEGVYAKAAFNQWGDMDMEQISHNIMAMGYDPNMLISFKKDMMTEGFAEKLNEYAKEAQERGAVVWYHFCPMNKPAVEEDADIRAYYDSLLEKLEFPISGNPYDCVMEEEWFYDTNFHLNNAGKVMYTRQLTKDIKAMLQDSSPTKIEKVQMPAATKEKEETFNKELQEDARNDESVTLQEESQYFLFETKEGQVCLVGLTQAGKEEKELILPAYWKENPVTGIACGAFMENESVERIVLGENITIIEDGAFSGCDNLKELVLPWENPSECMVGSGLLEGTKADILVPEEAVTLYKVSYTWSAYALYIKAGK